MRSRGFTLIELVTVVCVVMLLFAVALDRLLRYQEMGERAALEQNLAAMNSALVLKFAAYVAMGRPQDIANEVGQNPITLLSRPPENYLGDLYAPDIGTLPRATWYFDRAPRELVYLPHRSRYLTSRVGPPDTLRFRIVLTEVEQRPNAPRELPQPFVGPTQPFKWLID